MPSELQTQFRDQLPKFRAVSFEAIFNYIAGLASIGGLVGAPFVISDPTKLSFVYLVFISLLVVVLMVYVILMSTRKLHRYAQSVVFTHYVNHVIRDSLHELTLSAGSSNIRSTTVHILDAIAALLFDHCWQALPGLYRRAQIKSGIDGYRTRLDWKGNH